MYSSLIIVKSLQLRGLRKISAPRKDCFVCVFSLWRAFSLSFFLFNFFLTGWEFGLIPYNWYQSLGLGLSGSNGSGSRKGVSNRKV